MTTTLKQRCRKWLRDIGFYASGFDALAKRWDKDMSKNKCFLHALISIVLSFIAICDLFADFPWLTLAIAVSSRWNIKNGWKFEKERRTNISDETRYGRSLIHRQRKNHKQ
jgi:hypothetical protein